MIYEESFGLRVVLCNFSIVHFLHFSGMVVFRCYLILGNAFSLVRVAILHEATLEVKLFPRIRCPSCNSFIARLLASFELVVAYVLIR